MSENSYWCGSGVPSHGQLLMVKDGDKLVKATFQSEATTPTPYWIVLIVDSYTRVDMVRPHKCSACDEYEWKPKEGETFYYVTTKFTASRRSLSGKEYREVMASGNYFPRLYLAEAAAGICKASVSIFRSRQRDKQN